MLHAQSVTCLWTCAPLPAVGLRQSGQRAGLFLESRRRPRVFRRKFEYQIEYCPEYSLNIAWNITSNLASNIVWNIASKIDSNIAPNIAPKIKIPCYENARAPFANSMPSEWHTHRKFIKAKVYSRFSAKFMNARSALRLPHTEAL